jgi:hypothetical protein
MSEELKPKIEALRQATIDITPYYPYLQHDISDIVYDHFSDEVQAGASAEYTQLAVNLAPALVREIDALQAEILRLRNALTRIANSDGPRNITTGEGHSDCVWTARRALKNANQE